jgi:general secretion pathway protein C
MLDARSNVWLSRLQGNAPRLVAYVLAALIVLELAHLAYALIINPVKSPQPSAPGTAANSRPLVNVQQVVNSHLFGVPQAEGGSRDPDSAPPSSANVLLTGTIATDNPKHGVAIVSEGGGASKVYSVGDRLAGASLHSVYLDRVILDRNGALETVALPRQLPPGSVSPPRRAGGDPHTAAAVDNIRRMVQQDPSILDQVMRTVPSFDNSAGKLRGFRAFPGKNRQIFSKLGLRSGDLVTAINGTQLDDPQRSQEVFNTIQTSDHVTVTVERGGQRQDITLNVAQVAAQASEELDPAQNSAAPPAAPPNEAQPPQPPPGGSGGPPDTNATRNGPPGPQPGTPPSNDNQNPNQ